ncbi:GNAT family N-acetyltransferase [Clostridium sp. NSJ-6]|uniref:GNAT family N-acetyltransferase n=1 Tax=Clostridium hominis TaxID=2763036 RepID=A0ABR7DCA0_9CLOT|nr:GNAT family N-acetyltransferase [Clostridium hominis]MBC5629021.1 GNAT family N-acetyltransferase [Clostridium hominis]MDU2671919.1 GNAT family N-acetyltransferase [Clostridium sp.]
MNNLNLRDASECDAPIIAELVYVTEDDPEHEWGEGSKEEILDRISYLVKVEGSRYYYKNIKVAELDGKPCGAIILLKSDDIPMLDITTSIKLFMSIKGVMRKIKFIRDIILASRLDECEDHEIYVANLATSEEVRGKGIGKSLMILAEKMAKEQGYKRCSLLAKDKSLINFYSKLDYKLEKEERYFSHNLYRMVKMV